MIKTIYFRHSEFRAEQKKIVEDILKVLNLKKNILIQAPTGTGKTDAALSSTISYAIENNKKVLFLTPKTSQHKIALEVIKDLNLKYNLNLKVIDFVGKKHLCIEPGISQLKNGFYEVCRHAIQKKQCPFYLNIKPINKTEREITEQLIKREIFGLKVLSAEQSKNISYNFRSLKKEPLPLCPYEFSKVFAKECNIIIADYNHLFSKKISSSFLQDTNIDLKECIVIIDEAHNLENRITNLLSKTLSITLINRAIKESKEINESKVSYFLKDFTERLEVLSEKKFKNKKNIYEKEEFLKEDEIIDKKYLKEIDTIITEVEDAGVKYIEVKKESRSALITVALFLENWFFIKSNDFVKFIKIENNIVTIKNNALDVSKVTKEVFENSYSNILMSATLNPLEMYKKIYGLSEDTETKEYLSSFSKDNRMDILINSVTTKFTNRNQDQYKNIANKINEIINYIPGNTVIFFPSFEILREVEKHVKTSKLKIYQEENSSVKDFDELINNFKDNSKLLGACLFAVMGGKASEGIDLPGNFLLSAIIVGIPLSKMEIYIKAKIDFYEKKYNNGWDYAYIQPAMQKVIQSAGRVIRNEKDRGMIFYLDSRYEWSNYKKHLSKNIRFRKIIDYKEEINKFFT